MEKDNKELKNNYERLEKKARTDYNELYSLKDCVSMEDCGTCYECVGKMWYDYQDLHSVWDVLVCDNCWNDKGYFVCDNCDESYGDDEEHTKIKVKSKSPTGMDYDCELCENCWDEEKKRRHKVLMMELISQ